MAIGAKRASIVWMLLRRACALAAMGIVLGLGGALFLTRYIESMLFGLTPLDPARFALVSVGFILAAVLASLIPARRATQVDPVVALRHD
jgi:ABC-type antimicrobial peptide transport system permease subunit